MFLNDYLLACEISTSRTLALRYGRLPTIHPDTSNCNDHKGVWLSMFTNTQGTVFYNVSFSN